MALLAGSIPSVVSLLLEPPAGRDGIPPLCDAVRARVTGSGVVRVSDCGSAIAGEFPDFPVTQRAGVEPQIGQTAAEVVIGAEADFQ